MSLAPLETYILGSSYEERVAEVVFVKSDCAPPPPNRV